MPYTFTCVQCQETVTRKKDNRQLQITCSVECAALQRTIQPTLKDCPRCSTPHLKPGVYCSRKCANARRQTNETKKKISAKAKANPVGAVLLNKKGELADSLKRHLERKRAKDQAAGVFKEPKSRRFLSTKRECLTVTKDCPQCSISFTRLISRETKFCSQACYFKSGTCGGIKEGSSKCKRSIYNGFRMDSGSELQFARLMDSIGVAWIKNVSRFFNYTKQDGKQGKYYPDFYLPDYDFWVEIKGRRYVRPDDHIRRAAVGENIQLMMDNAITIPRCIKI